MARKTEHGHSPIEEAMAVLIQNQAAFVGQLSESERHHLEFERQHAKFERETAERFVRIEAQMAEIIRVLEDHGQIMARLTDAIREKIGFKG